MTFTPGTLSKGEFAAHLNVSPSRVSHWIADGLIGPEAIDGEGRKARIRVDVATAQLRSRRDVGQALGNGITVRLGRAAPAAMEATGPPRSSGPAAADQPLFAAPLPLPRADLDPVEERIKAEKLAEIQRRNRLAAAAEAAEVGRYIETAAARREMGRVAGAMLQVLEQALGTFATAIAEQFRVPQRDAMHLLKTEFRKVREQAAEKHALAADALPAHVEDGAEAPDDDAARPDGADEAE